MSSRRESDFTCVMDEGAERVFEVCFLGERLVPVDSDCFSLVFMLVFDFDFF